MISIVVSVFNEEKNIPLFYRAVKELKTEKFELIFVNDGSTDESRRALNKLTEKDKQVKVIHFSRNFGHEAAMIAGIDHSKGDAVICIDADLQHPVKLIPKMVEEYQKGYDVVKMKRKNNSKKSVLKNLTSSFFYWFISKISKENIESGVSDFFLISSKVRKVILNEYRFKVRFLRGIIQNIGFRQTIIDYEAPERIEGESKYNILSLFLFSMRAIVTTSKFPLRIGTIFSLAVAAFGFIVTLYSVAMKFLSQPVSGYTTIVVLISFLFSLLFLFLGILAEYIGFIFNEVQNRPIYVVDEIVSNQQNKNIE